MNRPPPAPTPPKFVIGSKVRLNMRGRDTPTGTGTVVGIKKMTQEALVRTAYAAGFWMYTVAFTEGEAEVSGNLLELAVIDTLGQLVDE
jgi:hypothetical protein